MKKRIPSSGFSARWGFRSPLLVSPREGGQPISVSDRWYDNRHCPNGRATTGWVTDGETTSAREEILEKEHGFFAGGGLCHYSISNATYAIEVTNGKVDGRERSDRPATIVVWPGCDPQKLGDALAPIVYGEGADHKYPAALGNLPLAQKWAKKKFTETVDMGYRSSGYPPAYPGSAIGALCEKHGAEEVLGELLHPDDRAFLKALKGEEAAVRYVLSHYRVVAVNRGGNKGVKFAKIETPAFLGKTNSVHLPGHPAWREERGLEQLLQTHSGLRENLWQAATEKVAVVPKWADLAVGDDEVRVGTDTPEFLEALRCLSDPERGTAREIAVEYKGYASEKEAPLYITGFLQDGSPAALEGNAAVRFPIQVGEKKHFVLQGQHFDRLTWWQHHVWGVTVERTPSGVEYSPFDNGKLYTLYPDDGDRGEMFASAKPLA